MLSTDQKNRPFSSSKKACETGVFDRAAATVR
jgi:hypothetical protein